MCTEIAGRGDVRGRRGYGSEGASGQTRGRSHTRTHPYSGAVQRHYRRRSARRRSASSAGPRRRRSEFTRAGLEVADDGVDNAACGAAGAASQRGDGEPHRISLGGRREGAPQGHLQGCARRIWGSETTGQAGRGTMSEDGRAVGGRSWLPKDAGRGAGLELVVAGGDVEISRVGSVSGDRSGRPAAGWSKTRPWWAQLRALSGATWVHRPNSGSAIPKRITRWTPIRAARAGGR